MKIREQEIEIAQLRERLAEAEEGRRSSRSFTISHWLENTGIIAFLLIVGIIIYKVACA